MNITEIAPMRAGKNRRAKTVFPNRKVDIFDINAIKGGTEAYPQARFSPR